MKTRKILLITTPFLLLVVGTSWLLSFHHSPSIPASAKAIHDSIVDSILIVATGDAMMHMPQLHMAQDPITKEIRFDSCFALIQPFVKKAKFAIVNFETTLAGEPYSGYPRFSAPVEFAQAIANTGFNVFMFANNHACDKGSKGIEGNLSFVEKNALYHAGIYRNITERNQRYPLIVPYQQWKIAFLNYTYGTNNITPPKGYVVNYIDTTQIAKDIKKAKEAGADLIISMMHWGEEYQLIPNAYQRQIAAFLLRHEVQIILGSHPHVIQPIERFIPPGSMREHLVVWSMGNFISNQKDIYTDAAMLVFIQIYFLANHQTQLGKVKVLPLWRYKNNVPPGFYLIPAFMDTLTLKKFGFTQNNIKTFQHVIEYIRRQTLTDNIEEYNYERN